MKKGSVRLICHRCERKMTKCSCVRVSGRPGLPVQALTDKRQQRLQGHPEWALPSESAGLASNKVPRQGYLRKEQDEPIR